MNRKIAVFTHFYVCNFGANLQALSTNCFLKKNGWDPIFINWVGYQSKIFGNVGEAQVQSHYSFVNEYLNISPELQTAEDIYAYLVKNEIFNVILGSDAVFALDTFVDRIKLGRRGFELKKSAPDKIFPNPFWLEFLVDDNRFKIAVMSVSSQNCFYQILPSFVKKSIKRCLNRFDYISVRDEWTKKMVKSLSGRDVEVTPDPVWAFNDNCSHLLQDEMAFRQRFSLEGDYILLGFQNVLVDKTNLWLEKFVAESHRRNITCVPLPFAFGYKSFAGYDMQIQLPLNPLDWYMFIRYSKGYVGYNMHPIVSSLHNSKFCVSVDNYGVTFFNRINFRSSSKIYDVMKITGNEKRCCFIRRFFNDSNFSPENIFKMMLEYDVEKANADALSYLKCYKKMMKSILDVFEK